MIAVDALAGTAQALVALADDELAVGHVLTSVAGFGPELEINIALSSMGQDELGHARAYYGLALGGDRDAVNAAIYGRSADAFLAAPLSWIYDDAWEQLVVKSHLFETADAERRATLAAAPLDGLAPLVERMEGEERYHLDFWRTWLARTCERGDAARRRVQDALDGLWGHAEALFDVPLGSELVPDGFARAQALWVSSVADELAGLGLTVPLEAVGTADEAVAAGRERVIEELQHVYRMAPGRW